LSISCCGVFHVAFFYDFECFTKSKRITNKEISPNAAHPMSAAATVSFTGSSSVSSGTVAASSSKPQSSSGGPRQQKGESALPSSSGLKAKAAALVLPNEFLSTRLIGCRVVVFLTVQSLEIEGTLLEVQDDDTLLLGQAIVLRSPEKGCTSLQREVVDRFPKMAVHGRFVAIIALKPKAGDTE
jgi:hypothetical protein